jgi:DNA-binding transcriptional MerR regulator
MAKKYYQMRDVCEILNIPASTVRFWEENFPHLKPSRSSGGHRTYDAVQLDRLSRIKKLLKEEGLTIEGAKKRLAAEGRDKKPSEEKIPQQGISACGTIMTADYSALTEQDMTKPSTDLIKRVKNELEEILTILERTY